jgi:tetratricopeptide (TPR) repeat protein
MAPAPPARLTGARRARALLLPLAFTLALCAFALLPSARRDPTLLGSFWGVGAALLAWNGALLVGVLRGGRTLGLEVVLRRQHWVQACAQLSVFAYWGWYWRQVYQSADLIAIQLVFAYAFDALLAWSRRDTHTLGFGPFPIIFSTNLFLWFKPDWFYLQFLLVALGFTAKELIRWQKEGRRAHVFNPSSFPLAVFSLVLILTGNTHLTWGEEIAYTQQYPPHIYPWIFLAALPGQLFFGVTLMTMSAVVTAYAWILLHSAATGTGYFFASNLPIATFLGMHLLFTDPSTSPRTDLGRIAFGVLYASSVVALFGLLEREGIPSFYDKLLMVPILNLLIQGIDRAARSRALQRFDPAALVARLAPRRRNLAYVSVWAVVFAIIQSQTSADQQLARHQLVGLALLSQGETQQALSELRQAVRVGADHSWTHENLGMALVRVGNFQDAVAPLRRAIELQPDGKTHHALALALAGAGQPGAAIEHFQEAIRLRPDWVQAWADLAWLRATSPDAGLRDAAEAVRLASRAAELSGGRDPAILDTLAAAYASAGRFEEAIHTAQAAESLCAAAPELAAEIRARLELYRAGRPVISGGFWVGQGSGG